jgi:outer membrane receptor protein involved in Fe transport
MAGGDDAISIGLAFGGAFDTDDRYTFRVSAHSHSSNGFRENAYLNRDDTNGRDETALRARLRIAASDDLEINLAAIFADVDNGYDAFALDNSYTMLSDRPGKDAQRSSGASLRLDWSGMNNASVTSITAIADSDIDFSFDADWGNSDSWAPVIYDYISVSTRQRRTVSQELRIASNESGSSDTISWLLGVYAQELDEDLLSVNRGDYYDPFYDFADSLDDVFDSDYSATSSALFGQVEHDIAEATTLSLGLRAEHRSTDYADSAALAASPSETMWGGEASIRHAITDDVSAWFSLSRGYKAGGFNLGLVPDGQRSFHDETLTTLEAGMRTLLLEGSLSVNASVFASRRDDQQVRTSLQLVPGDPASFVFFTDNAATGKTLGLEADLRWMLATSWDLYANIGLLDASFDDYQSPAGDLGGRAQAHAPRYTFAAGAQYRRDNGFFARLDMTARDDFYFDISHNQKSESYRLLNARIGFETDIWLLQLWARNLFDKDYAVRGFYFGNEPPDFPNTLYTRRGDPRQVGATIEKRFD